MTDLKLWYEAAAREWTEALPIGNGRLGAMVFGGVPRERLQLNEDTLWTGGPYSQANTEARLHLDQVRELIFAGRYADAEALADRHLMGRPLKQMSYQPAGDLWIERKLFGEVAGYRRELDLDTAVVTTTFRVGETTHSCEMFATAADQVIVIRLSADQPGSIGFTLRLTSGQPGVCDPATDNGIGWHGRNRTAEGIEGRLTFAIRAQVRTVGGSLTPEGSAMRVDGADEAIIIVDAATSFKRFDDTSGDPDAAIAARLSGLAARSFEEMRLAHIIEHQRLFRRLAIDLGSAVMAENIPTDRRIAANPTAPDPTLSALYVQFGRYLMIASSRPGTQPATLQGIWNDQIDPPWGSKYTTNINLQMNYWLTDPANLSECMEPMIRLVEEVSVTGAEMAAAHYGAGGWVLHHNTDIWRAAGPIDGAKWGLWPTGGAWLCVQLWDHAVFAGRPAALVRRLYPLIAGAARFILDTLVLLPGTDLLVTNPSLSPENVHLHGASLVAGPAMDRQIIRDLFDALVEAAVQLGIDDQIIEEAQQARQRLPADRIGQSGQLQEWLDDWDLDAPEINHRHVSHLYGLYPSRQIELDRTPNLASAARRSLEIRGDDATGWGIGWRINLWARLRQGDHAHEVLTLLLSPERTYPNMFDAHPPFQIDGNFGGAAGILEMLVQSGEGWVDLLPALPSAWQRGTVRGVCARGGLEVDLAWMNGRLAAAGITAKARKVVCVRYRSRTITAELNPGHSWAYPVDN